MENNDFLNDGALTSNPELMGLTLPNLKKLATHEKTMSVKDFRKFGYLQELNRLFLHPLGLALVVTVSEKGEESFLHIADYRDEGINFDEDLMKTEEFRTRVENVAQEFERRFDKTYGRTDDF